MTSSILGISDNNTICNLYHQQKGVLMFERSTPNMEEVKTRLIKLAEIISEWYWKQINEYHHEREIQFTSKMDLIPGDVFIPQAMDVITKDVAKQLDKDKNALNIFIGEQAFTSIPIETADLYILMLYSTCKG